MNVINCPAPAELEKLFLGGLPESDAEALDQHVMECGECLQKLKRALGAREPLAVALQKRGDGSVPSPVLGDLMQKLLALRPASPNQREGAVIVFACPRCKTKLSVKEDLAGQRAKCPCGQVAIVPARPMLSVPASSAPAAPPLPVAHQESPTLLPSQTSAPLPQEKGSPEEAQTVLPVQASPDKPATLSGASESGDTLSTKDLPAGIEVALVDFLGPPQADDEIGRLGQYRILKVLGHGGMGVVYMAEDSRLKRTVALKAMLPALAASAGAGLRFQQEAESMAKVEHDHIVRIYQVAEDRGVPYMAMEFLKGESLDDRLKRDEKLPIRDVLRIGREIAEGLHAAHATGLIHRDIKPANLWLEKKDEGAEITHEPGPAPRPSSSFRVKILDFGLARAVTQDSGLTQQGSIIGTPAFMAPEQARGDKVDVRCDLFSLGVVLYRLCSGQLPFRGRDTVSTLMEVATHDPPAPRQLNAEVPQELSDIIMSLLRKDPEERPASAAVVVGALRDVEKKLAGGQAAKPVRRRPVFLRVALAAALLGVIALGGAIVYRMAFRTADGTLIVEVEGDEGDVRFKNGELQIYDEAGKNLLYTLSPSKQNKTLPLGSYVVKVTGPQGLKLNTDRFEVTGKSGATIRVFMDQKTLAQGPDVHEKKTPDARKEFSHVDPNIERYKNSLGMEFVKVPAGKAYLGGGDGKPGTQEVVIDKDFFLGVCEVTQGQWEKVLQSKPPCYFSRTGDGEEAIKDISDEALKDFPVENVTWNECQLFLSELNRLDHHAGWEYRLPTEKEWEYACRGGPISKVQSSYTFYLDQPLLSLSPKQANVKHEKGHNRTCKVGSYIPNRLGLYDMHGNVSELTHDDLPEKDEAGAPRHNERGGGWTNSGKECGAAGRYAWNASDRFKDVGLRVARVPVSKKAKKKSRNPFNVLDVVNPFDKESQDFGARTKLKGDAADANAAQWAKTKIKGDKDTLDGDWMGRWRHHENVDWVSCDGAVRFKTVGDRVFILYKDFQGLYLIETRSQGNRLVGTAQGVDNRGDRVSVVFIVVGRDRIDGEFSGTLDGSIKPGRFDFRRKLK